MKKLFASICGVTLLGIGSLMAAVPAEITAVTADATTVWGDVKTFIFSVVGVLLLLGVVKLVRKR